jgi:putative endonuclease
MAQTTNNENQELGDWGEAYAAKYLEGKGYQILARNVRTPYGEIDIIAKELDQIIFVEVKTRTSRKFGYPEDAITESKITHLIESAEFYLQEHPEINVDWRIDVIAIQVDPQRNSPAIAHFEDALA